MVETGECMSLNMPLALRTSVVIPTPQKKQS